MNRFLTAVLTAVIFGAFVPPSQALAHQVIATREYVGYIETSDLAWKLRDTTLADGTRVITPVEPVTRRAGVFGQPLSFGPREFVLVGANDIAYMEDFRDFRDCWFDDYPFGGQVTVSSFHSGESIINPKKTEVPWSRWCNPGILQFSVQPTPSSGAAPSTSSPSTGCTATREDFTPSFGRIWYPGSYQSGGLVEVHIWSDWAGFTRQERKVLLEAGQRPGFRGGGSAWTWPIGCESTARDAFQRTGLPVVTLDQLRSEGLVV